MKRRSIARLFRLALWFLIPAQLVFFGLILKHQARNTGAFDGVYVGNEAQIDSPPLIHLTLSHTPDGFINGRWSSAGRIRRGLMTGEMGPCKDDVQLLVTDGECQGLFSGQMTVSEGQVKGSLANNTDCPGLELNFELKKL